MILTLEVIGEQAEDLGAGRRKIFDSIGGTIGRFPDNDWVFPDPYVSGRHALIRYVKGQFFVEDTSTNGVFVNSHDQRIPRAQAQLLADGDVLFIDAYRIQVSIQKPASETVRDDDPFEFLNARARDGHRDQTVAMVARERGRSEDVARGEEPSIEWFGALDTDMEAVSRGPTVSHAPKQPAKRIAPHETFAEKKPEAAGASDASLRELIKAAGIEGVEPSADLAKTLGCVLRVAVGGVMEALRNRERVTDDMRMRGTTFKPHHNNPLQFSANVDDAFHNMFVKHNAAYLPPPQAVDDALQDVRDHQAAIVAAMHVAFGAMLAQFDPARLQEEFDRQIKGSILGAAAKLRYWDLYREKYVEMLEDSDTNFLASFGEAFAKAYEDHLERLHALARNRQK